MAATMVSKVLLPAGVAVIALGLAGCDWISSTLTGEGPESAQPAPVSVAAGPVETTPLPAPGSTSAVIAQPGQTFVGQRADALRADLTRLQSAIEDQGRQLDEIRQLNTGAAERYFSTIARINARLQVGSTPGNPILSQQWGEAQSALQQISDQIGRLQSLSTQVNNDNSFAGYLLDTSRSVFLLSGAVEEDHRKLAAVEDDIGRAQVAIDRLNGRLLEELNRQTASVATERRNLATLAAAIQSGELISGSLDHGFSPTSFVAGAPGVAPGAASATVGGRPLVTIRFDRTNVAYEQPLFDAVRQALDRRPGARFQVVATPGTATGSPASARRNADQVVMSLVKLGLSGDRVTVVTGTGTSQVNEVQVYVR